MYHSVSCPTPPTRPAPCPQHVICAAPKLVEKHLKAAGGPGLVVHPAKILWTPYNAERDYKDFGR